MDRRYRYHCINNVIHIEYTAGKKLSELVHQKLEKINRVKKSSLLARHITIDGNDNEAKEVTKEGMSPMQPTSMICLVVQYGCARYDK
jgi:hypothetical protein